MDTLEVVWNGEMDKRRACFSLTTYAGQSQLTGFVEQGQQGQQSVPYRRLAVAVLQCAVRDSEAGHPDAHAFLCGGPMLAHWCELAGLKVDAVREASARRSCTSIATALEWQSDDLLPIAAIEWLPA